MNELQCSEFETARAFFHVPGPLSMLKFTTTVPLGSARLGNHVAENHTLCVVFDGDDGRVRVMHRLDVLVHEPAVILHSSHCLPLAWLYRDFGDHLRLPSPNAV